MSTYSKKPSLDDARARIGRAKEHIATVEREIVAAMPPDRTITTVIAGGFLSGTRYINPPPILPILIGETIYNLRAALDYLVYELFYLDTGETTNITKFVIEDSEQSWAYTHTRYAQRQAPQNVDSQADRRSPSSAQEVAALLRL